MKVTQVTVAAGAGFTNVRATIPAHRVEATEDAAVQGTTWEVQFPDDNYATTHVYQAASTIKREGNGVTAILGRPVSYNALNIPAVGDIYFKIRDKSATGGTLRLTEFET